MYVNLDRVFDERCNDDLVVRVLFAFVSSI